MKMSEKTLLKKIEQAFKENYCNGSYKVEVDVTLDDETSYVLFYTYKTGEVIALDINVTRLGEVKFYSPVHSYYISNFNNHIKSVINVLRMLFDMIDSNKKQMISYYEIKTEETEETEETVQSATELNQYFDTDVLQPNKTIIAKIENIHCCPNRNTCFVTPYANCDYNYKSDSCIKAHKNFINDCERVHKQMKAISNPEWHHVSLATLANIDNDMLDEKRRLYFALYRELKKNISNARKCKTIVTFDRSTTSFRQKILKMYCNNEITALLYQYFLLQLSMLNVEYGAYDSSMELATGLHESRRYNKIYCNKYHS